MAKSYPLQPSPPPFPMERVRVFPLEQRKSLTTVEQILVQPDAPAPALPERTQAILGEAADRITAARERGAAVMLIYGAHLLRNGAALILDRMMANGWVTHLATNGAGTIHDWEYAYFGRSTESVEENVETGTFGTWDETARHIHWGLYAGSILAEGYGASLGRYITQDGTEFPLEEQLAAMVREFPNDPVSPALCDLLVAMRRRHVPPGRVETPHQWKHASVVASAFRHGVPLTVHPGIGYDIISNHPIFNGALVGRAAAIDFRHFASSVEQLDGGVVLSIGSAIMGPQVFEKTLSCVNNIRIQEGRPIVHDHSIYVVDLQDGGNWDWTKGEPPKTNPAYYLRFCKSYSRMGGRMQYLQSDNMSFVHALYAELLKR